MLTTDSDKSNGRRWVVIQGNQAMSWRDNVILVAVFASIGLLIATGFAVQGLWLVFPFVGLEIALLSAGLYACLKGLQEKEVITVTASDVTLERGVKTPRERVVAARGETRVKYRQPENEFFVGELNLDMGGRIQPVGRCLGRDEKGKLARQLRELVD
ncbi:MAG: DUF2244 domain-containing protein [Pseudomonadota bacterium]